MAVALFVLTGCGGGGSGSTSTSSLTTVKSPQRTQPANPPPSTVTTTVKPMPHEHRTIRRLTRRLRPVTPTGAVKEALTARDPLVCVLYTPSLLKESFGGKPGCRSAVRSGGRADSVEIVSSHAESHHAVVVAVPHGGPSSAEKLRFLLALTHDGWRLDSIKSNVPVGP
jgi:hypothetical protein